AVPAAARQRLATVVLGAADPAGGYRLDIARDTLRLAGARPVFGWGLAAFADALPAYKRAPGAVRTVHAESDALQLLAERGAAGLLPGLALAARPVAGPRAR